jgi:23S rRNA (adenine2503-C2)-methyltransferase
MKIPASLLQKLSSDFRQVVTEINVPDEPSELPGADDVIKFHTTFVDGVSVESVILPSARRTTICVSSQSGCRMGCFFCATGASGFFRNLNTDEILFQVHAAKNIFGKTIDNVVFMGMGEPFDNLENVVEAIRILGNQKGFDIPYRRITVSTAGHVDGLRILAGLRLPNLRIAVSINSADNNIRSSLMPINRTFPLDILRQAMLDYPFKKREVFFIEYIMISEINDSIEMAQKLSDFLKGIPVRINLIPFNPCSHSQFKPSPGDVINLFKERLVADKYLVRIRMSKGQSVLAGCGQLGTQK